MATAPRRETLIALRARRTAHQVATDVHLAQHAKSLLRTCKECGRDFAPERDDQDRCQNCVEFALTFREEPVKSRAFPLADFFLIVSAFLVVLGFIVWFLWPVREVLLWGHRL